MTTPSPTASPQFAALVERFIAELPRRVSAIRDEVDAQRREEAARLAHQLRGAGGGYGFPDVSAAAAMLEEACSGGDLSRAHAALRALAAACEAAASAVG